MDKPLVNRIANSSLTTINLELFLPKKDDYALIDIKDFLFKEFLLKEADFRQSLKTMDWQVFKNKNVAVFCSNDAILPQWSSMLIATYLIDIAKNIYFKTERNLIDLLTLKAIESHNYEQYLNKPVIIKGCGNKVTEEAYLTITTKLIPYAKSIMYGEACSTVPIFKKKKV